ncbi:hypothetical protein Palpr_1612 [Paludibacter propionicigenes WB4]|uniref:Peptidase C45 acyl-coenzyme A:6-aminopenicillanic acid acyl-transferase n=1 Tax=Paludibacter propionicigenes (strain DSM 17365 / JCM 13257 / WB4) TaxID=694427 RepID=E4T4W1_PALPW|nr:hypothetical protein [Paludibacter propionicigenes]ADQ79755.1 hypothetical protein Palpr_1612 [Paludibacter propionicigenes WB4]
MKQRITVILTILIVFFSFKSLQACTTAVVSGKYTADGRPMLFKQRDTPQLENKLVAFQDGKYPYLGLVNTKDTLGKEVFGGFNKAGFAIMNSASYNLNPNDSGKDDGADGLIMKQALQKCATLADFERLLDSLPKPLNVSSNFGVIDAKGGAAYYETGNYNYKKYDANNPDTAPFGYIIRTNFSYSGDRLQDKGLARYESAQELFSQASLNNSISVDFLIDVTRYLKHGITKTDLLSLAPDNGAKPVFVAFRDYIPRYLTASSIIVQGVKVNESPTQTVLWTILGSPLTTVAIPVWITSTLDLPKILIADKTGGSAKLNEWSLTLKKQLFPIERGEGSDYINLAALISKDKKGILQNLLPIEKQILNQANTNLIKWRSQPTVNEKEIIGFYNWVDKFVTQSYHDAFNIPASL